MSEAEAAKAVLVPKTPAELLLEEQARGHALVRQYLDASRTELQKHVDQAKVRMREIWNRRAPPAKGKAKKGKKK